MAGYRKILSAAVVLVVLWAVAMNAFQLTSSRSHRNGVFMVQSKEPHNLHALFKLTALAKEDVYQETRTRISKQMKAQQFQEMKNSKVHVFAKGKLNPDVDYKSMKNSLGGKGAYLASMMALGLSVPPGFTMTTEVCADFHENGKTLSYEVWQEVLKSLKSVEQEMGKKFGDSKNPLLFSVRSGAAISMPGMMETILNLGLNDETVEGLSASSGERVAWDSYRRLVQMYGSVVLDLPHHAFESCLAKLRADRNVDNDNLLTPEDLRLLVKQYKDIYVAHGKEFPTDPYEQLHGAVVAVFDSWMSEKAIKYREAEGMVGTNLLGTAVNVQVMVFGNMGDTSGTGVCFTRNPSTGANELYGEYLVNAQGEDVVAGIRTPEPISALQNAMPEVYEELLRNIKLLEENYNDMLDIEFTVEQGKLYMLQTRSGKRSGIAAIKIACDLVKSGLASADQAIMTVKPEHLNQLLHPQFANVDDKTYTEAVITRGLPASPGAGVGHVVFDSITAEAYRAKGEKCILVREETSPEDVGGMWASDGVLTARGGMTSHAAVVARGWGKPCVCGVNNIMINEEEKVMVVSSKDKEGNEVKHRVHEGDFISLNGDTGEVLVGRQTLKPPSLDSSGDVFTFMKWVDDKRNIKVLANADTPADAKEARRNGAQGIGLTRTEHMFFSEDRIRIVRRMILAKDEEHRRKALAELLPLQQSDFEGILEAMDGLPVTVRLLDPPLHEFLPKKELVDDAFAADVGMTKEECLHAIERMSEVNPMLGLRGCRLGVVMPELVEMQTEALIQAALDNKYKKGLNPCPEIMIPLIGSVAEYTNQANLIKKAMNKVFAARPFHTISCKIGTMIEVPRAALTAASIAKAGADFFSYGTNDLTQMTYGFSRDDVGSYLPTYLKKGIIDEDPFEVIDQEGVGALISLSTKAGREATSNPFFKAGVCGEHGGDPKSVRFFIRSGLNYVSCSPFRIPVARLAAAQCVIEDEIQGQTAAQTIRKVTSLHVNDDPNDPTRYNPYSPRSA